MRRAKLGQCPAKLFILGSELANLIVKELTFVGLKPPIRLRRPRVRAALQPPNRFLGDVDFDLAPLIGPADAPRYSRPKRDFHSTIDIEFVTAVDLVESRKNGFFGANDFGPQRADAPAFDDDLVADGLRTAHGLGAGLWRLGERDAAGAGSAAKSDRRRRARRRHPLLSAPSLAPCATRNTRPTL